jgi:uncharacterized protein YcfJ
MRLPHLPGSSALHETLGAALGAVLGAIAGAVTGGALGGFVGTIVGAAIGGYASWAADGNAAELSRQGRPIGRSDR